MVFIRAESRDSLLNMNIYLAGLVPKGNDEIKNHDDWRHVYVQALSKFINAEYVDPRDRGDSNFKEDDFEAVFALDCTKIKNCDLLLVNGDNLGVGGAQEILIAKYFKKPVITVLPKNTVHRRTNLVFKDSKIEDWIHPFLYCTCDLLLENIEELTAEEIDKVLNSQPKDLGLIDCYIDNFKKKKS